MDADQIEKIAKDANDTSTKALNLLMKTLDGEGKTNKDIDELNRKYVTVSNSTFLWWILLYFLNWNKSHFRNIYSVRNMSYASTGSNPLTTFIIETVMFTLSGTMKQRTWLRTWRNRPTRCMLRQRRQATKPWRSTLTWPACHPSTPNHWRSVAWSD